MRLCSFQQDKLIITKLHHTSLLFYIWSWSIYVVNLDSKICLFWKTDFKLWDSWKCRSTAPRKISWTAEKKNMRKWIGPQNFGFDFKYGQNLRASRDLASRPYQIWDFPTSHLNIKCHRKYLQLSLCSQPKKQNLNFKKMNAIIIRTVY